MIRHNYTIVRSTALSIATAIAASIPTLAMSSQPDRAQASRRKSYKATSATQKDQAHCDITLMMKSLHLDYELKNDIQTMSRMVNVRPYGAECLNFKTELKGVISDFLAVIYIVPALSSDYRFINNLETALALVDYIPGRNLLLMWKTLGDQLGRIRTAVNHFSQNLSVIPPLKDFTFFNESTNIYEASEGRYSAADTGNNEMPARSLFNRSFLDFFQARIEMYTIRLNSFSDLMPKDRINTMDHDAHKVCNALLSNDQGKAPLELVAITS